MLLEFLRSCCVFVESMKNVVVACFLWVFFHIFLIRSISFYSFFATTMFLFGLKYTILFLIIILFLLLCRFSSARYPYVYMDGNVKFNTLCILFYYYYDCYYYKYYINMYTYKSVCVFESLRVYVRGYKIGTNLIELCA